MNLRYVDAMVNDFKLHFILQFLENQDLKLTRIL